MSRIDTTLLREINCGTVLTALRAEAGEALRLAELSTRTGLSRPTVGVVVDRLVDAGWVEYVAGDATAPGRPARLARFRSSAGYVLGIDAGPHKVLAVLADLRGETVAAHRVEVPPDGSAFEAMGEAVDALLAEAEVDAADVMSCVIGAPGVVADGQIMHAPSVPTWTSGQLIDVLAERVSVPIEVHNDANLAVLAERWRGAAVDAETVVFIQWGTRLGTGILIGDRLHRGAHGAAGEIGFSITPEHEQATATAEGLGPLEQAVSPATLVELARQYRPDGESITRPEDVFAAARDGDGGAKAAIEAVALRLARGLAPLVLTLDPDMVVLGGGLSLAGEEVLNRVRDQLAGLTLAECQLELSALGARAVVLGAVRLALDDVETRLLPLGPTPERS